MSTDFQEFSRHVFKVAQSRIVLQDFNLAANLLNSTVFRPLSSGDQYGARSATHRNPADVIESRFLAQLSTPTGSVPVLEVTVSLQTVPLGARGKRGKCFLVNGYDCGGASFHCTFFAMLRAGLAPRLW